MPWGGGIIKRTPRTASANPTNTETIDFGTDGITVEDKAALNELIAVLGGTSYGDLSTKLDSGAKDASNFTEAKTVTLGGVAFNVVYVSKADYTENGTNEGDIIVTLWMAESNIESQWNTFYQYTTTDSYPTNMYSSSLIRSTLVGTPYLTWSGAEALEGTGEINEAWQPFNDGGAFYNFLATPANMAWQETLSAKDRGFHEEYNFPNEAWGSEVGDYYEDPYGTTNMDYRDRPGYFNWKNDRLWLPALSETGAIEKDFGVWATNKTQISDPNKISWLRSGIDVSAGSAWYLTRFGLDRSAPVSGSAIVRPAVHFNLKAVAEVAIPPKAEVTVDGTTTQYASIEEAWAAANNAEAAATVKMLADAETQDTLTVEVGKEITLDLNGCMLKYNNNLYNSVIRVNGTFTLEDNGNKTTPHTITNPVTNEEVTINGGLITGGKAGGVEVNYDGDYYEDSIAGTFTMTGGTISGNTSLWSGGGVFVDGGTYEFPGSTFIMSGGTISGNKAADNGGGVYVAAQDAEGGESLNLTARSNSWDEDGAEGGGLFKMWGGTISGNTARYGGGVYVGLFDYTADEGKFEISGAPVITGNQNAGSNDNVYLYRDWDDRGIIKVTGALTEGAQIGVTLADGYSGVFTSGYGAHNGGVTPSTCFISDAEGYVVGLDGDEVKLVAVAATVTVDGVETTYGSIEEAFTYANDNSTLTESAIVKMFADAETTDTLTVETGKNITLNLNGHILKYTGSDSKSVIAVNGTGTFTLDDSNSQAEHCYKVEESGLWTFGVGDGYTHTLHGGVITGGKRSGVIVSFFSVGVGSTFIMEKGNICGNADSGVYVGDLGYFEMKGGKISGNTAVSGGGVNANVYGCRLTITGGIITENTASDNGGGIFWAGVPNGFQLSGAPVITGNKVNGNNNNACVSEFYNIKVTGALEMDGKKAQIGINGTNRTGAVDTGSLVTGFTGENFEGKDPSEFFIPDDPANNCIYVSDEENGTVTFGTHTGGTATCTQKALCSNCGKAYGEVDGSNHDYATEFTIDKAPTCTEAGSKSKHCSRCGDKSEVTVIPALPHTLTHYAEKPATTEEDGNLEHWECENCEKYFSDEAGTAEITDKASVVIPKLSHNNALWIILTVILCVIILVEITVIIYRAKRKNGSKENK